MKKKALALLKKLSEASGPAGTETAIRRIFRDELGGEPNCDKIGNIVHERAGSRKTPRVMVTGHMDEVGFAVQNITSDGFLRLATLGGWWGHTLLSQRVRVMTQSGKEIMGLITSTPVHFLKDGQRDKVLSVDKMYVDVGVSSAEEVSETCGIAIGDPVVPETPFDRLHVRDRLIGKAFDNRVGVAITIQAAQELAGAKHPNTLFAVGTVQEEVGTRGAETAAAAVQPDVAIVMEAAPADDAPGCNRSEAQGVLGNGVQIRMQDPTAIMNRGLVDFIRATADKEKIPYQLAVRTSGGTDAKKIHLAGEGVPTVVLGVPARYIHSHNSIIDIKDYLAALQLTVAVVKGLDKSTVAGFTDYETIDNA